MAGDAIVVGEDWISEHYFTTDATRQSFLARVIERRKDWDERKDEPTVRSRFTAARTGLLDEFARVDTFETDELRDLYARLREVLGYAVLGFRSERHGPVVRIASPGLSEATDLAVVEARPAKTVEDLLAKDADNLLEPYVVDDKDEITSVARLLSSLFVSADPPAFALVQAGAIALVAERTRWAEGRYLAVDLQLVAERNDAKKGGEVDRALTCLSAESLAPDAEGNFWWHATLEDSVKHTVGVSKDLREGVRLSIEIIANEIVDRRRDAGLPPLPKEEAQPLAKQSLRFLYRILFLLYAEASPELGVLPTGTLEYERGYSLDRLRDLTLVELATPHARNGTHLYESLAVLFDLVDRGHEPKSSEAATNEGLTFRSLRADLFKREATAHIDEVKLGNAALQRVLQHLLLSKESRGKDRGFISYAELGINQLGAVYEGLMSYTGFFAETDLYEVAKGGDASKGSWVVPVERAEGISPDDFVKATDPVTGESKPVLHQRGGFVFRLAGRERQQSASYYTPEVLTRFVVSQALAELLDQDGTRATAEEVLGLTICEPALGSGAFAIEAVRQLADEYLKRRQDELDTRIDPDEYPRELQKVKAYLALHRVYGVDLNATAVELAEISLWLDTMVEGLAAPWFGLHLRRGNSLIGARRQVYRRDQVEDKTWLSAVPERVSSVAGRIPHFLLPAEGWGSAAEVGKDIKELAPDAVRELKDWRKTLKAKPGKKQADRLVEMGERVQRLWEIATRRLEIAEQQIRRHIPLWGRDTSVEPVETSGTQQRHVTREEIEDSLADVDGAYQRLRRIMDAWCALWFWPLTEIEDGNKPPTPEQWYDALGMLLGGDTMSKKQAMKGDATLDESLDWDELGTLEENDRIYADARRVHEVLAAHPWLETCQGVAERQGFLHWELDFASVFASPTGGFDLQTGNPPWVRPDWDEAAALAEHDVRFALEGKMPGGLYLQLRRAALDMPAVRTEVLSLAGDQVSIREFASATPLYPHLEGLRPDLYRCFMERAWAMTSTSGVAGLVHPETHFTGEREARLRSASYSRLRRHWQFHNALVLFDIDSHVNYGVHIYGSYRATPSFLMASSLYHPDTVLRSLSHDGSGPEPGLKDLEGKWDVSPHRSRILRVDEETLASWHAVLGETGPVHETKMVYAVNQATSLVMEKLSESARMADLRPLFSMGWNETTDYKKGHFLINWGAPASWSQVILQGPHFHVSTPMNKFPNPSMRSNGDWSYVDLESLRADQIPITTYKPSEDTSMYDQSYTHWDEGRTAARDFYRVVWRAMAANTGERTLIPSLVPPGTAHINAVFSVALPQGEERQLAAVLVFAGSVVNDFLVRAVPKSGIYMSQFERLAINMEHSELLTRAIIRVLRLNCLTSAYADLWSSAASAPGGQDGWTGGIEYPDRPDLERWPSEWSADVPLRRASDRRQAMLEIDALVAIMLGLSADQLCTVYRTQFPVLYGYDRNVYYYDTNGRLVPNSVLTVWRKKGDRITQDERTARNQAGNTYTYELPFVTLDREADMRQAYAHFEKVLAERS